MVSLEGKISLHPWCRGENVPVLEVSLERDNVHVCGVTERKRCPFFYVVSLRTTVSVG